MAKSNTNKRYAIRKLGKILFCGNFGLTLFLRGIYTSFVHAAYGIFNMSEMILEIKKGIEYMMTLTMGILL